MNKLASALAAAALVAAPVMATAQSHGGHGGFAGHGGFRGHGFRGGGFRGGPFFGGFGLGLALGAFAFPWYYDYPYYYGYGWPAYWDDGDYMDGPPPPRAQGASAPGSGVACGSWNWLADQSRYQWTPGPCGNPPAAPQGNPGD